MVRTMKVDIDHEQYEFFDSLSGPGITAPSMRSCVTHGVCCVRSR
jgi:hypothetical protein